MSYKWTLRSVFCGFFLCAIAVPARQATRRLAQKAESGNATILARSKRDACILLTSAEIEAVQGEPVKEAKASGEPNGGMLISECLFHTTNSAKSVSVALATPASAMPSALTPRKFWQKQFHAPYVGEDKMRAAGKTVQEPEPKHEQEAGKPRRIEGIGEDAYWVGTPIAGALYVLKGSNFVRISVGGVGEESVRIENSKALARVAVRRL